MNAITGGHFISQVLLCLAPLSGIAVIAFKAPIRSLLAAILQWLIICSWLILQGAWTLGLGFLLMFGIFYLRAFQFFRAMGLGGTETKHSMRYSQVVGMLGGTLLSLFVALQFFQNHEVSFLYAWLIFATGLIGVMVRRNAFSFLLCLQMMFNASLPLWAQIRSGDSMQLIGWDILFLVAFGAYWLVGWSFFVNRLLATRPLDIDAAHMLKN